MSLLGILALFEIRFHAYTVQLRTATLQKQKGILECTS